MDRTNFNRPQTTLGPGSYNIEDNSRPITQAKSRKNINQTIKKIKI